MIAKVGAGTAFARQLQSKSSYIPRLPASPFQRAAPITPADRTGAYVDYFPVHTAFPAFRVVLRRLGDAGEGKGPDFGLVSKSARSG